MNNREGSNSKNTEENRQSIETSVLFEKYSFWIIITFLLLGVWFNFIPFIIVNTFLLLLNIVIGVWKKLSLINVKPTMQISSTRIFAGEEFEIQTLVFNDKWLPLIWFEWTFPQSNGIVLGDTGDTKTIRFLWLLWFQSVKLTLAGKTIKRGVYDIGKVTLRSGDGFRFSEIEKIYNLNQEIYVYPELVTVNVPNFRPTIQWGVEGKKGGFIEDPLLIEGTREYQVGDELRRFNWRASARTGKLQTNTFQPIVIKQLMIYIDVCGFQINIANDDNDEYEKYSLIKRQEFEYFLSVIASVAVKYKEQGINMGFYTNGRNHSEGKMEKIYPSSNLTLFLDELAKITQSVEPKKMKNLDELLYKKHLPYPVFIFCNHVTEDHYTWFQNHKGKTDINFYYKIESEYAKKMHRHGKSIDTFL